MWNKISRLFTKTNLNLKNDSTGDSSIMDLEGDLRRMSRPTHDSESQDTYDTRQAKQRASVKWLLSKSFNNKVPENIKEPFYRDHDGQEHLKPQIVHKLANAELYCLGLSNIYSDPNYHNLNHSGIIQTLVRKGVFVSEPPDAQLTETVLIQTTPLKMSAHMAVIEAMMMLYAKEVVTPDRVVAAIQRFTQSPRPEPLPVDYEDALLLWVNKACSALKQKIIQELGSVDEQGREIGDLQVPELSPVRELKDLCDGVGLAALVSFYCPEELPWTDLVTGYLPTISDSVHNVRLVYNFCNHSLPCSLFHMMPEDVTYMRGTMKQNLIVFLADLFNVLEIHPVKCVRFPGSEMAFREVYPRNSQGVAHKRSLPQSIAAIPDLRSSLGAHSGSFSVSISKSCPVQTSLPARKSVPQPSNDLDDEQFVVHHGRGVPTLSSVVQAEEPLVPARLRPAKEKHNQDSKAEERGEPAAAGRPSHWEDARRSSYAGRRSRRNSITAEDSQLTIENFGGSQEHLNFIGRNPDKEVGAHTGRKASTTESPSPATPLRTSAQEARSSGVELIFQDTTNFTSEKRDEEKFVSSKQVIHSKQQDPYEMDLDLGSKVATSFAELSRLKDSGTFKKSVHTVYMQQDQDPDDEQEPPPKTILNKKPVVNSNGSSEKKVTTFAALPNNTTTWQQQSSSNQNQPTESVAAGEENSQVMASQLLNIRMKLEEKRRRIEGEKRRMEVVMNKQRQKVGKAAFLQAVTKGKNSLVKTPETDTEKETNCDMVENTPLRPFSLQEIGEDASSVEHKWLESGVPFVEERKTPDIENMDLEQYQQSISQMNTSLHDIQSDIQRLTSQQNQIQDLSSQQNQMQGFVSQQQQQFQGLANQHQQQLHSLATQQHQIQNLAFQQQQLQSFAAHALVRTQSVDGPSQFYLHDQPTHRRTWAQPSMQTLPHDLAYPHPLPDSRMMWADNHSPHQPTSFNTQPSGFVLHEPKPAMYSQHSNSGADERYQNGDNHQQPKHHSLGAVNHMGTYKQSSNNGTGFQLHPEPSPKGRSDRDQSPGGYSSSPSDYGSRSPPSDSPQHRAPPVPPRHHHHTVNSTPEKRASTVTHAPMPTPPVDDMEPQSISFIGMPGSNSEDPNSSLAQSIKGLQITSGSRTYRIPSPTRPAIARNSFQQQEPLDTSTPAPRPADLEEDETVEKGFYISFDNDPQPLRPKPPLRTKRMSPKKERAVSQFESPFSDREEKKSVFGRPASYSDRQESSGYNDRKDSSSFKDSRGFNNREDSQEFSDISEPRAFERKVPKNNVQSRLDPPVQKVQEPRKVERNISLNDIPSPGVGLVIGNELLNPEPSTVDEMERKKERIMLLSLQRRQQQEELKQNKEHEADRRREHEKYKQEERERKKEEERERRQIILEQYKLKKATEEAEREGKVLPNKSDYSTMKPVPKMRNKSSAGTRPRPKTIHVDSGGDAHDGVLSPSRSKKGSSSNLADPVFNSNSRRDYYRGSQDNLADRMEQRRGVGNSLLSRDSPDDGREGSPSRGANQLGRRGSYKTSRDTSEPRRVSGRPKYPSYQGTSNFRGRKSNSLMNLSGSSTDQDSMAYRYGDTDSGLGRATPPRRAPSPGMSSMRHLPSPSGPGSLPPGLMTKRRPFDDGSSDISSNPSSMMEYNGPRLYKQPSSKSNRPIMLNAVEYCVFPGVVNREAKRRVLEEISRSESKHFLILFRDAGCQFRALYSYCPDREEVAKLYGTGPKQVNDRMFDRFFKYNSGGKCFSQIHTKHLTVTIDAFTIHNSLWQGKKVSLPNKKDMVLVI